VASLVERMRAEERVPGVAVTAIEDFHVAWTRAFGVANSLTRTPLGPDAAFAAASLGKPIVAWLALREAGQGTIDLDAPVLSQAAVDLPRTPRHERITPRQLIAHTSGLGNFLRDRKRDLAFDPGTGSAYSGVGYMVLQELLERRTGRTLDALARERLFTPLRTGTARFEARSTQGDAVGHMALRSAIAPFGIVAVPAALAALLAALCLSRIARGRWRLGWPAATLAVALGCAAAFGFLVHRSGSWTLGAWFSGVALATAAMPLALLAWTVHGRGRARARIAIAGALGATWIAGVLAAAQAPIPLPAYDGPANAASSLHASSADLARFLVELARPTLGATEGIAHWHTGSNPGARALMVVDGATGKGVVVLANAGGTEIPRAVATLVMGREACWRVGCP
jgi:CubicO group peptidase (beta-lactamase class C family)